MTYWKNFPNADTPLEADNLEKIFDFIYPINTGFIAYDDTDYSNHLGLIWEKTLIGRTPVGLDNTQTEFNALGKTGGAKTHTLTIAEMPSHGHDYRRSSLYDVEWTSGYSYYGQNSSTQGGNNLYQTASSGGDQPHNNLPPYEVVNFWKRVA